MKKLKKEMAFPKAAMSLRRCVIAIIAANRLVRLRGQTEKTLEFTN